MQFVTEIRHWWKFWSVRLAVLAGAAAGWITANPQTVGQLVAYVPEQYRPIASVLIGILVATVPTLARMMKQPKLEGGDNAGTDQ